VFEVIEIHIQNLDVECSNLQQRDAGALLLSLWHLAVYKRKARNVFVARQRTFAVL